MGKYLYHENEEFALLSKDCKVLDTFFAIRVVNYHNISLYKTKLDYKNNIPSKKVKYIPYHSGVNYNNINLKCKYQNDFYYYYYSGKCIYKSKIEYNNNRKWNNYYIFGNYEPKCVLVKDGKEILQGYIISIMGDNLVVYEDSNHHSAKIYNKNLKEIYSCEDVKSFSDGVYSVKKGGKWGFIDKNGKEIIEPQYDNYYYDNFHNGKCFVGLGGYSCYIIDKNNDILFECLPYNDLFEPKYLIDGRFLVLINKHK